MGLRKRPVPQTPPTIRTVELIGHRGGAGAPENTLNSFGWSAGKMHAAEWDIDFSLDNKPVVIHDFTVDRTTDGTGDVTTLTLAQLKALDAGSYFDARFAGARIPELDEVLEFCGPRFETMYPEFKRLCTDDQVTQVIDAIKAHNLEDRVVVTSFWPENLAAARSKSRRIRLGYECIDGPAWAANQPLAAKDGNADLILDYNLILDDPAKVETARKVGVDTIVYVVNTQDVVEKMLNLGITRFITDYLVQSQVRA